MTIHIIAAVSTNGVIGQDGKLPWVIKEDLANFKEVTTGKKVIMGRRTLESLGYVPLANRTNIVLTTDVKETKYQSTKGSGDLEITDDLMKLIHRARDSKKEFWVIGGAEIYALFMPFAETFDITTIGKDVTGKMLTFMPKLPSLDARNIEVISEVAREYTDLLTGELLTCTNTQFERV